MKCTPIPEREDWFITYRGPSITGTFPKVILIFAQIAISKNYKILKLDYES
jgi:hypothetical protein